MSAADSFFTLTKSTSFSLICLTLPICFVFQHKDLISLLEGQNETVINDGGIIITLDGSGIFDDGGDNLPPPRFSKFFLLDSTMVTVLPKITGILSMIGSSCIVYSILGTRRGRNHKLKTSFHRLLLALSLCDIISSFAYFLSFWPAPTQVPPGIDPEWYDATFPGASGNKITCNIQVRSVRRSGGSCCICP